MTDFWEGIEEFFEPRREILVAHNADEVALLLDTISPEQARNIGRSALSRALGEHTYAHRADEFEKLFEARCLA